MVEEEEEDAKERAATERAATEGEAEGEAEEAAEGGGGAGVDEPGFHRTQAPGGAPLTRSANSSSVNAGSGGAGPESGASHSSRRATRALVLGWEAGAIANLVELKRKEKREAFARGGRAF